MGATPRVIVMPGRVGGESVLYFAGPPATVYVARAWWRELSAAGRAEVAAVARAHQVLRHGVPLQPGGSTQTLMLEQRAIARQFRLHALVPDAEVTRSLALVGRDLDELAARWGRSLRFVFARLALHEHKYPGTLAAIAHQPAGQEAWEVWDETTTVPLEPPPSLPPW